MEKKKTFEEKMLRLEEIVSLLEKGDARLDASMALFTEGAELVSDCRLELERAEQQVLKLTKGEDGAPVESPFDTEE